jgi:hypothetical protein
MTAIAAPADGESRWLRCSRPTCGLLVSRAHADGMAIPGQCPKCGHVSIMSATPTESRLADTGVMTVRIVHRSKAPP